MLKMSNPLTSGSRRRRRYVTESQLAEVVVKLRDSIVSGQASAALTNANLDKLAARVTALEGSPVLAARVAALEARDLALETAVRDLDTRVTALEVIYP